jgi:phytoene dehydrogenase-like protein
MTVLVIGAGVGGLAAAIALAQRGVDVEVLEGSPRTGGLAGPVALPGPDGADAVVDGGPYVLLDPLGLRAACAALGIDDDALDLRRIDDLLVCEGDDGPPVHLWHDLDRTVEDIESHEPGQGLRYRAFVDAMRAVYAALAPLQRRSRPSPWSLVRAGAVRHAPFLLRSLGAVARRAQLSPALTRAVGIWTHVAGQSLATAPSILALVGAIVHGTGAYVPRGGLWRIPQLLEQRARAAGVRVRTHARVARIDVDDGVVRGVTLAHGEHLPATRVVSNAAGVATLSTLLAASPHAARVRALPLQGPGVAAFGTMAAGDDDADDGAYLRFAIRPDALLPCLAVVRPHKAGVDVAVPPGRLHVRVVAPVAHAQAQQRSLAEQEALLSRVVDDPWVRARAPGLRVHTSLVPRRYGERTLLHDDSMNPVMTARFMRQGRLPHRLDRPRGLYLVGSATHPGQWVSFCMISGVLGAGALLQDEGAEGLTL